MESKKLAMKLHDCPFIGGQKKAPSPIFFLLNQFLCLGFIPVGKVIWWMGPASPFPFSKAIKKEKSPWKRPAFQYVKEVLLFMWSAFSFTVLLWPLSWPIKRFNPAPSVPGATLFTGSFEVCPSGVGTSHFVIRAAPRFSECHLYNNKQAAYPLSFRSAAPQPR